MPKGPNIPASVSSAGQPRTYGHLQRFREFKEIDRSSPQANTTIGVGGQPAWFKVLDGGHLIQLYINPQTYRESTESLRFEAPTLTGYMRLVYGSQPMTIELQGTTGTAGWDAADQGGMTDLIRLKPKADRGDVRVSFHFPYMFDGGRICYINRFDQETTEVAPLYYYYTIEMTCYDPTTTEEPLPYEIIDARDPYRKLQTRDLPAGGTIAPIRGYDRPFVHTVQGQKVEVVVPDCHYSVLNLPWVNPTEPPNEAKRTWSELSDADRKAINNLIKERRTTFPENLKTDFKTFANKKLKNRFPHPKTADEINKHKEDVQNDMINTKKNNDNATTNANNRIKNAKNSSYNDTRGQQIFKVTTLADQSVWDACPKPPPPTHPPRSSVRSRRRP